MAIARDQLTTMSADMRERTKAIRFPFVDEIGVVERLRDAQQPHGGQHHRETTPSLHANNFPYDFRRTERNPCKCRLGKLDRCDL